ncbi:MAG: YitT family protein [Rikenellaceae bacterium]
MNLNLKNIKVTQKDVKQYCYILLGSFLIAAGYVLFITPYQIVPGGVYGAGVALNYIFPEIQVGWWGLMLDIPLMIIAFIFLGGGLGLKTIFAAVTLPMIMNTITSLVGGTDPEVILGGNINLSDDIFLSCIVGGVIVGAGVAFILRSYATSGGTDIVGVLVSKWFHIPVARSIMIVDSLVVIFGLIIIGDWLLPLYSLVTVFTTMKITEIMIDGSSDDKLIFIISKEHEQIRKFILEELDRGGTFIKSHGMYTKEDKEMIFVVISRRETLMMQDFIRSIDNTAFMVVVNAHETLGDGFKKYEARVGG